MAEQQPLPDALDGIAIVGLACRVPGARTPEQFWSNLAAGVESVTFFSDQELLAAGVPAEVLADPSYVKAAPILDQIDLFDAAFFGFSPREAELMDPQQRLFLEAAWEALENAGYDSQRCRERIGVFAGVRVDTYWLGLGLGRDTVHAADGLQTLIGNDKDYLSTQVCYKLDLRGPGIGVQTACSTSLVAVVLACQSLATYGCDMALAGGVAVRIPQVSGYFHRPGGIASPDGHCRAFDAAAQGSVFGSGLGIVVLKRLEDAVRDGDRIHAVIKGWAVNNDGSAKVGYTAPSVDGQSQVIATAQALAGASPDTIGYVETHGTGTALGDPIEIAALDRAFRAGTERRGFCAIGSVKTNIGHLDSAAGVAGLIKTTLALRHRMLPPSLNCSQPNPKIDFAATPFYVNTELRPWASGGTPRRAGVSSFGIGGTNAHLVLEEAPALPAAAAVPGRPWQLLLLSARTPAALEAATRSLAVYLEDHPDLDLADVAFTLQAGRRSFRHRRTVLCRDRGEAVAALESQDPSRVASGVQERRDLPVALLFPGQGAQHVAMGRELYQHEPLFRREIDRATEVLTPWLGLDLRTVLYPAAGQEEEAAARLAETAVAQPALLAVEMALARLWLAWGVKPKALAGHSVGEYAAACLAGVFSLEDGLALLRARGWLMNALPRGAMLAVHLSEAEALARIAADGDLALAAVNGPRLVVVSGPEAAIAELERRLAPEGTASRRLHTSHAFHSAAMDPILDAFAAEVGHIRLEAPTLPVLSNLTGTWLTAAEATDPQYWTSHLRRTVRFADNLTELRRSARILLEVGPGNSLGTLARQQDGAATGEALEVVSSMRHPKEESSDVAALLTAAGRLWLVGATLDWAALHADRRPRRTALPTYPFERQRFWLDEQKPAAPVPAATGRPLAEWFQVPVWRQTVPPHSGRQGAGGSRWLLFLDRGGLLAKLAATLRAEGCEVVTVAAGAPGGALEHGGDGADWRLDPRQREGYAGLFAQLAAGGLPDRIVQGWSLGEPGAEDDAQDLGFFSLLYLAQMLADLPRRRTIELRVLSSGVQAVTGEERLHPQRATLLGPCTVIPQELPHVACQSLDLALPPAGSPREARLLALLRSELAVPPVEPIVAYRAGERWVRAWDTLRLPEADPARSRLRPGGVYLVTGGFGGVGLAVAEELARSLGARLVLTGRTPLPARESWEEWLAAHAPGERTSRLLRRLLAIEAQAGGLLALAADVTDREQMAAVVAEARRRFGALHGVLHAAGVAGGGLLRSKSSESAAAVLAPKVAGTLALEAALAGVELDFLALFSSTIGVTGDVGQMDYCAANAFLDAFARARAARDEVFTVAIDWDGWRGLGMKAGRARAAAGPADLPAGAADHPLLGQAVDSGPDHEVFVARLSAERDWVLAEHQVQGRPVLPGTAYLEMARALAARKADGRAVELRDLTFLKPLVVADGQEVEVRAEAARDNGFYRLRVASRAAAPDAGAAEWEEHAVGVIAFAEGSPAPSHAIEEIARGCAGQAPAEGLAAEGEHRRHMQLGPRWGSVRRVEVGSGEALVEVELPEAFAGDLDSFGLHPALLDRATAFGVRFLTEGSYLPFGYRRLTVRGPLPRRVLSHVRSRGGAAGETGSLAVFDLTIMNEAGTELVDVEGFTLRRIDDAAAVDRALGEPRGAAQPAAGDGAAPGIDPDQGIEALQRILCWATVPQVAVSRRDLAAAIEEARTRGEAGLLELAPQLAPAGPPAQARHARPELAVPYMAPRDETERLVAELWERMLGLERVGIADNFFELGGHSLLAIQLISELRDRLGVDLHSGDLFAVPTVVGLAARIAMARGTTAPAGQRIEPFPRAGELPLSFAQERQWFMHQLEPDSPRFNHAAGIRLSGRLAVAVLARSLDEMVRRHESLRTTFAAVDGRPVQQIAPPAPYSLPRVDLAALPAERREDEAARLTAEEARRPFDLTRGPLLRATLLRLAGEEHAALFTLHHIAGDHWSAGILMRELMALYAAFLEGRPSPLPDLPIQYADYAQWQRHRLQGEMFAGELQYWRQALAGSPPILQLPTDRPRPTVPSSRGAGCPFELSPELTAGLEELCRGEGATPFMALLALFDVVLHRHTGQRDIVVGSPIAGRDRSELEGLVGYFINALALRTNLSGDPTFRELLARVRTATLGAYAHQDLPFERLVEELAPERRPGYSPIFQVVFNFQNAPMPPVDLPGLTLRPMTIELGVAKYDLTLYMWHEADRLAGSFQYRTDLFDAATIERLRADFAILAAEVVARPDARLAALVAGLEAKETEKKMIREDEVNTSNLKKLRSIKRRAVSVSHESLVRTEYLQPDQRLPLVVSPNMEDVDLTVWAQRSLDFIERELAAHGGILFRGFAIHTPAAFEAFVNCITPDLVNYVEGSSPRIMVGDKVYTSTEYPPEYFVSMHNELSYAHKWPSRIFFYCHIAPQQGGETPIADSRKVYQLLPERLRREFEQRGVRYLRNLHGGQGAGLAWQTVFETGDREAVEAYCREGGIRFAWKEDGGLSTSQDRPAVIRHPVTGDMVWFNQVDQWHPSNLTEDVARALLATTRVEDLPIYATFADGTPLDAADLEAVRTAFREAMVVFPWQQGDVLLLDNTLTAHGRMPFSGPRKVLVAMGGTVRLSDLPA